MPKKEPKPLKKLSIEGDWYVVLGENYYSLNRGKKCYGYFNKMENLVEHYLEESAKQTVQDGGTLRDWLDEVVQAKETLRECLRMPDVSDVSEVIRERIADENQSGQEEG